MSNTPRNIDTIEEKVFNATGYEHNKRIEDAIDAIRLALHEKTKGMTAQEFNDHIGKEIAPIMEQLNLKSISRVDE
ncbi:MAG: hypothetical protein LBG48_00470 [Rickettsiales bacterium]|jgi:uncharacterized protein (DUF2267 family)|nr:hypothetical protein [Rickettsiales bacterium]